MYDELIRQMRACYNGEPCEEANCGFNPKSDLDCIEQLLIRGADAIETLYAAYTESFSVIAKAFRKNPKDLVLREYMMKNACCCEVEEGE